MTTYVIKTRKQNGEYDTNEGQLTEDIINIVLPQNLVKVIREFNDMNVNSYMLSATFGNSTYSICKRN